MKKALLISLIIIFSIATFAQYKIEVQVGGGNYKGFSVNGEFGIKLSQSGLHKIHPSFGLGYMFPSAFYNTITLHSGLNYTIKNWGIGMELNGFTDNPFWGSDGNMYVDMMLYPNLNYHLPIKSHLYFKISVGAFIGFAKDRYDELADSSLGYIGNTNPGAGISFGYRF